MPQPLRNIVNIKGFQQISVFQLVYNCHDFRFLFGSFFAHFWESWATSFVISGDPVQALQFERNSRAAWNHKKSAQANLHTCRGSPGETRGVPGNVQGRTTGGAEGTTTIPHAWRPLKGSADFQDRIDIWIVRSKISRIGLNMHRTIHYFQDRTD